MRLRHQSNSSGRKKAPPLSRRRSASEEEDHDRLINAELFARTTDLDDSAVRQQNPTSDDHEESVAMMNVSSDMSRWSSASAAGLTPEGSSNLLLGGLPLHDPEESSPSDDGILRPRRQWKVSDTKVPVLPPFWPRPADYVLITASPAVIAIRIAECLWKRSVSAEFDDEAATATCRTIDRCQFSIHLWKGESSSVIVECVRVTGSPLTYHSAKTAVLAAAQSLDSGADRRTPYQVSPSEYPRLISTTSEDAAAAADNSFYANAFLDSSRNKEPSTLIIQSTKTPEEIAAASIEVLENAFQLLCKDRWEAQLHGMHSVVAATDVKCVGVDFAVYTAQCILGSGESTSPLVLQLHRDWIVGVLVSRQLPSETSGPLSLSPLDDKTQDGVDDEMGLQLEKQLTNVPPTTRGGGQSNNLQAVDDDHAGHMRALALRAFTNALAVLAEQGALHSVQSAVSEAILDNLCEDLQGASRPATIPSRLASPHEAALAVKCLGLLALSNEKAKEIIREKCLGQLEKAAAVGRSTHAVLGTEARRTYRLLTEEDRSC